MKLIGSPQLLRALVLVVTLFSLLLSGLGLLSAWGPDTVGWLQVGREDPSFFEQLAERERRAGEPPTLPSQGGHSLQAGDFLRISASLNIEDGMNEVTASSISVANAIEYDVVPRTSRVQFGMLWPMISFAVAILVLVFIRTRRSQAGHRSWFRERWRAILFWGLAGAILLPAAMCAVSLIGVGTQGGVAIHAERPSNDLYEPPPGIARGQVADVRLDWRTSDGGLWLDASLVRYHGFHVSSYDSEVRLGFRDLPRMERSRKYLGTGFFADGMTFHCGGWLPIAVAIVVIGLAVRQPIRRHRRAQRGLCAQCGYDLRGNVSGRCSECGSAGHSKL